MVHPSAGKAHTGDALPAKREILASAHAEEDPDEQGHQNPLNWPNLSRVVFVAIAAGVVWFARGSSIPYITIIGAACAVAGGYPIYREAFDNIVHSRMTMELSMAIAIVAALAIQETFTALVITLFVLGRGNSRRAHRWPRAQCNPASGRSATEHGNGAPRHQLVGLPDR